MQLLPYDRFTIQTQEPLSDLIERLDAHIEAPKAIRWSFSRNHAPYEGIISRSGFEIHRIIHYRNSFLPNIQGRFESLSDGTLIYVTLKLHPFVIAFLLFWCSVWYSISIPYFLFGALSGDVDVYLALQFVGGPTLLLIVFWYSFWYEAKRSRHELVQIILGEQLRQPTLGNLARRASSIGFWIPLIAVIFLWNALFLLSSVQRESPAVALRYCSQDLTESPYCNFSVVHTLAGHATASALALSNDGKILVSGGQDKAIKVWDLQTGRLRKTLQSDSGEIQAVAIAPDGKTVVSGSGDRMVRIWNITSNQHPQMLKGHSSDIRQVEISSDGKTIISSTYDEIKVWDLTTGQLKATLPNLPTAEIKIGPVSIDESPRFYPKAISPDGKTALVELDSKLVAWDLATNQQKAFQKKWAFQSFDFAKISWDGQTAVTSSSSGKRVVLKVWNLKTGIIKAHRQIISSAKQSNFYYLTLSRDDLALSRDRIITNTNEGLRVWNLQTAEPDAILNQQKMTHLVISSDGKLLAGITSDPSYPDTQIKVLQRP